MEAFPQMQIEIYSNQDIDRDICYCVLSKHFICDNGGFSRLLDICRTSSVINNNVYYDRPCNSHNTDI